MTMQTEYYGIYILSERGGYWLQSDNGDEWYCGDRLPSAAEVDDFAKACRK